MLVPVSYRYDHLSSCLKKLLLEKPKNSADYIEDISRQIKKEKLTSKTDSLVVSHYIPILQTRC